MATKFEIDSNVSESRWSRETSFKVADASAVWQLIEPNSFSDAAAKFSKVVRNPIKADRQRDKGVLTDLDANFGFQTDITEHNVQDLMTGLVYAELRNKTTFGTAVLPLVSVNGANQFTAASGLTAFAVGDLVKLRGGSKLIGNINRVLRVTVSTATLLTVAETLFAETLPAGAILVKVGVQTGAGDIDVDASQALPALTSTVLNFTTLGLTPGESIWVGGDAALSFFPGNPVNNCLARIRSIAAGRLVLDKASKGAMITEAQAGSTIQLFFGRVLKNEVGALIVRPTFQLEQQLGAPDTALPAQVQSQYFTGAVFAEGTINYNQADKFTLDAKFVAADQEVRSGATGLKAGTRPAIETADAQNTTSDLKRVKLAKVVSGDEAPTALVTFIKSATFNINNNVTPLKALTVLGAFEMSSGDFAVSGNMDCYFADIACLAAVRDNADVTIDTFTFKNNSGWAMDLPLVTLQDGSIMLASNQPMMIPLAFDAASGEAIDTNLDYTCCFTWFDHLPDLAALPNS